jgi:adenylate cyclase
MIRPRIKSLQQRLFLFLLLPVALFLFGMGFFGFVYAKNTMLKEWREAAILRLERAAHHIDMRLNTPIQWIEMFHKTGESADAYAVQAWLLEQLKGLEGVAKVDLRWANQEAETTPMMQGRGYGMGMGRGRMMRFHRAIISEVTKPQYDAKTGEETVALISLFKDESGRLVGTLEVKLRFSFLLQDVQKFGWWQSDMASLVDDDGKFLAHTAEILKDRTKLGETGSPLEEDLVKTLREEPFGTIFGPGHPPREVCGFYRLKNAPWTIVLFAPGEKILAPIIRFRSYFFLAGAFSILIIVLLIRSVVGRLLMAIRAISTAAANVAQGKYGPPLALTRLDEIGQLMRSFNSMVDGLRERDFISNTFGRYVDQEVARELLHRPEAARLGGEKREVAILMSDLRNFTPLSENLSPEQTIRLLNRYFSRMIDIIQTNRGIIVDFFGDAILVFFDPFDGPISPAINRAMRCALQMQRAIFDFNSENRQNGLPALHMGIGLNAGEVVVGNIGSEARAKYGIVGAPVNLTNRIQSVAENGEIVVSEAAYSRTQEILTVKRSFNARLKGIQDPVTLYVVSNSQNEFEPSAV